MVEFICCPVPFGQTKVADACEGDIDEEDYDEEFQDEAKYEVYDRRKRRSSKQDKEIQWRRSKSKRKKNSSSKRRKKKNTTYDNRDEGDSDGGRDGQKEGSTMSLRIAARKMSEKIASVRSEEIPTTTTTTSSRQNDRKVFRETDIHSVKSDPLPASLPTSILAESFYSDDSLGVSDLTFEVDYLTSTPLFETLERNDWGDVLFFLRTGKFVSTEMMRRNQQSDPETQVRTWVHSQDENGELLWRQLPLHAAICLGAPLVVIQRLAENFPEALECKDSFGNLPEDLAGKVHGPRSYLAQCMKWKTKSLLRESRVSSFDYARESPVEDTEDDRPSTPSLGLYGIRQMPSADNSSPSFVPKDIKSVPSHRVWARPEMPFPVPRAHSNEPSEFDSDVEYSSDGDYRIYQRGSSQQADKHGCHGDEVAVLSNDNFQVYYY